MIQRIPERAPKTHSTSVAGYVWNLIPCANGNCADQLMVFVCRRI